MPLFTIKEIELHRKSSGKMPGLAIVKTLDRGKKFKEERHISADSITTSTKGENCYIKEKCKASMKSHIIALLCELAAYSLNQLDCVPERGDLIYKQKQAVGNS